MRLSVFNAAGQRVRLLVDEHQTAGLYLQPWDGRDDAGQQVASGAYLYRLEAPATGFVQDAGHGFGALISARQNLGETI